MKNNVYLIGFMGTGKSTVSRLLSESLGAAVTDADEAIVRWQDRSIKEIFELQGEEHFRNLETELLRRTGESEPGIISCGGGIVLREENRKLMKKYGVTVLLKASPETIYARVKENTERPVLNSNMSVAYITELMEKRAVYYEEAGEIVIDTDGKTPREISEEIMKKLKNKKIF